MTWHPVKGGRRRIVAPDEDRYIMEIRTTKQQSEESYSALKAAILRARRAGVTFRTITETSGIARSTVELWLKKADKQTTPQPDD